MLGKPEVPAESEKASMLSRRPLTSMRLPSKRTNRWTSSRNFSMSKKLPVNWNTNGMVGKPAEPTVAPGGSVAAAACVAGADAPAAGVLVDDVELDAPPVPEAAPSAAAGVVAAVLVGAGPWPPAAEIFSERKSMRALCDAPCSW